VPDDGGAVSVAQLRDALDHDGYLVLRDAVPIDRVEAAMRRLLMELRFDGLTPEQAAEWSNGTFFPHLRWEPEIWGTLPPVAAELFGWQEGDDWADPQLVMRFPDAEQPWPMTPHVDRLPEWATGRTYRGIAGVALTPARARDGAPCVWPGSHQGRDSEPVPLSLAPGDALLMHPQLCHSGGLNLGPTIRTAIYFRLLTDV
jgi:ectoine hydroxylase-related dioxygenase (phytanoyl-CoA dioxygenase family)